LSQFFKPLLGRTRPQGRCWAAIRLSHRLEPSGHAIHEEVDGLDIEWQYGRRFVLLRHTHRPQRRPYSICASRNGNVRHRCGGDWAGPRLFLGGERVPVSGMKMRSLVGLSAHPAFHWSSAHCVVLLLLSDELMRCCAAGTNGCLGLRRRASALDGQVSAEWSRCPGYMAWCPRDSVAPLRQSSAGWMPAIVGRLSAGVGRRHPVTVCKASLMARSIKQVWALRHQTGVQYSTVECTGLRWLFADLLPQQPNRSLQAASGMRRVMSTSCEVTQGVGDTWATCSTLLQGIWVRSRRAGFRCWSWL